MKKIYVNSHSLAQSLNRTNQLQALPLPTIVPADESIYVLDEQQYSIDDVIQLNENHTNLTIIYRLSSHKDSGISHEKRMKIIMICESKSIPMIREYVTLDQSVQFIIDFVYGLTNESQQKRVISFYGSKPQVGTTSMVLLVAQELTRKYDVKIGVLHLNAYNPSDHFYPYQGKYLDEIWGNCQGGSLTSQELIQSCHAINDQLHVLAGNRYLTKIYHFKEEGAAHLIKTAQESFDLVLIDSGCYLDHALSAQAIESSDVSIVLFDQSVESRDQWKRTKEQIIKPLFDVSEDQFFVIFNKMLDRNELENQNQLQKEITYPSLGTFPYAPQFYAHERYKNLFEFNEKIFMDALQQLCKSIAKPYEFKLKTIKKRNWF